MDRSASAEARRLLLRQRVGSTPLLHIDGIFVKLECTNPSGSIKDRIAWFMLQEAARRGDLRPDDAIVETTSGNTGIGLALAGLELGHRVIVFMPEHMSVERRHMMERLGAEVRLTPQHEGFEGAVAARNAYRVRPGYYVPDQFGNPDNVETHYQTTGPELLAQMRERSATGLDAFVAGVGTGGTLMGVGRFLREAFPSIRLVAVEPAESNVMSGGAPGEHGIMGIGDGFVPEIVDRSFIDEVACVSTDEAEAAANRIRQAYGYCVGISSGANMAAAWRLRARRLRVATVWPDSADRYGSVGLPSSSAPEVRCAWRAICARRASLLLRGSAVSGDRLRA